MSERIAASSFVAAVLALAGCSDSAPTGSAETQASANSGWQHPRTPWGDPDLQGMWPITNLVSTPFQRPVDQQGNPVYGDRELLTDEEYAATQQRLAARDQRYQDEIKSNKMGMGHWAEASHNNDAARLTSLLVEPKNGRFPALTERGKELAANMKSSWTGKVFEKPTDFDTWDRCITRGLPPSMFPFMYNNGIEILQAPGYVIVRLEMIHEARVVPITSAPVDSGAKAWFGYSRGRWEGNTLVVETTNFNGQGSSTNIHTVGSPPFNNTPISEEYVLTERFTRTGADTLTYQATLNDPVIWTAPWTVELPWQRDDSYQIFEYACHEDNSMIRNYIVTSRAERRANK